MVTAWPSARSALGSAAETSARPPTLTKGASSVVTKRDLHRGARFYTWTVRARARQMTRDDAAPAVAAAARAPEGVAEGSVVTVFRVPPEVAGPAARRLRPEPAAPHEPHARAGHRARERLRRQRAQARARTTACGPSSRSCSGARRGTRRRCRVDVPVLYEDEHLLAVDKPALLPVHPTARYHKNTLIKVLAGARAPTRRSCRSGTGSTARRAA